MNLLDATVTEIVGKPYFMYGKWFLKVKAECWGSPTESTLMFATEEQAKAITPGYKFEC